MPNARPAGHIIQGFYCALHPMRLREKRLVSGKFVIVDGLIEMRCGKCKEYWPLDTEFYFGSTNPDGHHAWCRACYMEWRYPERYELAAAA